MIKIKKKLKKILNIFSLYMLNLINFDHKGFDSYKPIVSNRFFFMYFKNKKFQVLTILFIELFSIVLFMSQINIVQFSYLYLLPVFILYIRNTKTYNDLLFFFVDRLKRSLITKLLALSIFIVFLYVCYINGAIRIFAAILITFIVLLFEAYRNMRLKWDLNKSYVTKRVIQDEVAIRSESELRLKYPFLKWFRDYAILRLMFCSSYYFMTKNGVILNEMLSVCALGFLWGTLQPNVIQRYANTPVVLEVLADLCKVPLSKFNEALLKDPLIQNNMRGNTVSAPKKILEFAVRNRLITVEQLEEIVRKSKGILGNNNGGSSCPTAEKTAKNVSALRKEVLESNQLSKELAKQYARDSEELAKQYARASKEQAEQYTRELSKGTRTGALIGLGLAGVSLLDNHYGFVGKIVPDFKVFRTGSEHPLENFADKDLIPYRSAEDKRLSICLRRYHVTANSPLVKISRDGFLSSIETVGYFRSIGFVIKENPDGSFQSMTCPDDTRRRICSKAKVLYFSDVLNSNHYRNDCFKVTLTDSFYTLFGYEYDSPLGLNSKKNNIFPSSSSEDQQKK